MMEVGILAMVSALGGVFLGAWIYHRAVLRQSPGPSGSHRPVIRDPLEEEVLERSCQKESLQRVRDQFGVPILSDGNDFSGPVE